MKSYTTTKELVANAFETLKKDFAYTNKMQTPKIVKVVVSAGVGSFRDKKKIEVAYDRIARITGQMPQKKGAKQSVANFKIRQGDIVGIQVTLRGEKMFDFIDRLIHIALPRTKDFRGISPSGIDEMGNFTFGIRENTIFPENSDEELKDVFGFAVTIVTNIKDKKETRSFLNHLGFPFKKEGTVDLQVKKVVAEGKKTGFGKKKSK
jgi:large subunit ribosomal protein L5